LKKKIKKDYGVIPYNLFAVWAVGGCGLEFCPDSLSSIKYIIYLRS